MTGNGFAASQTTTTLKVNFNGSLIALNSGSTTDANGTLQTASFTVPADPAGSAYTVKITDGTNTTANFGTNFTITPKILTMGNTTGGADSGAPGTSVTVTGNGFAAGVTSGNLKVVFGGTQYPLSGTTNSSGVLTGTVTFTVPTVVGVSGGYTVAVYDGTNTSANFGTNYTVTGEPTLVLQNTATSSTNVSSITVPSSGSFTATSGDTLIFLLADSGTDYTKHGCSGGSGTPGVTDSQGNTWTAVGQQAISGSSGNAVTEMWAATVTTTGTDIVTAFWGTSCSWPVQLASVSEWSGVALNTPPNVTDGGPGGIGHIGHTANSGTVSAGPITPTHTSGDLIISVGYASAGTGTPTPTTSGIAGVSSFADPNPSTAYAVYGLQTSSSDSVTWTTGSGDWAALIAAFFP